MTDDGFIGIDLGTTAIKVGLFDATGACRAAASAEFELATPHPGFAEFDADAYVRRVMDCIGQVVRGAARPGESVRAIGFSSQAQTFVLVGRDGRPVRPAVGWLDVRASVEAKELSSLAAQSRQEPINAIASGPKLLWLRRREPETFARTAHVMLLPDYVIFQLTGRAVSDPVTAGSTGLFDRWARRWIEPLLEVCGLTPDMMPEVMRPGECAGTATDSMASGLGLPPEVLVAVGTNDQYTGALGAGNVMPGCASIALGTALAIVATGLTRTGLARGVGAVPHPASAPGHELYALLAYAKTAGIVVRWFRDRFAPGLSYEELFAEAASVPAGAGGVSCVPHFSGSATPDFDPSVRGTFAGLELGHGRAHLARALVESLAFTVRENVELLNRAVKVEELRAIGGGAKSDFWLQMMADVTGVPLERVATTEAACLGAAELAMAATGEQGSVSEIALRLYRAQRRFEPAAAGRSAYEDAFARYRALYRSLYGKEEKGG